MNLKYFKLWIVRVTLGLLLLGISSITAAAQKSLYGYTRIEWPYSTVEVRKPDGTVSAAKFLSEIILLQDGRANGGFGIWEQNPPDILSLYHVVEGKQNGPYYTFKAQRLAPLPALEITVALRPASGPFYDGSVRFLVDASAAAGGLFSLEGGIL